MVGGGGDLLGEVAVLQHAGRLDDPAELVLAPAPAHLRGAQRGDQLFGLGAQLAGDGAHRPDLLAQLGVRVDPVALQLGDPLLVAAQGVVQRGDRPGHRLLGLGGRLVAQRAHRLLQPRPRPPGWRPGWPPAGRSRRPTRDRAASQPDRAAGGRGRRPPRPASRSPCTRACQTGTTGRPVGTVRRSWNLRSWLILIAAARRCVRVWWRREQAPGGARAGRRPGRGAALVRAPRRPADEPARRRAGGASGAGRRR